MGTIAAAWTMYGRLVTLRVPMGVGGWVGGGVGGGAKEREVDKEKATEEERT